MVTKDYPYEVNNADGTSLTFTCFITAMEYLDTANRAGVPTGGTPDILFHVKVQQNEKEYGIHPRCVLLARTISGSGGNTCLVQKGTIYKKLPILTKARFDEITEWTDEDATNAPATAKITLPHKPDGTGTVDYVVVRKIAEYHV